MIIFYYENSFPFWGVLIIEFPSCAGAVGSNDPDGENNSRTLALAGVVWVATSHALLLPWVGRLAVLVVLHVLVEFYM